MWRQDKPDTIGAEQAAAPVSREFMQKILATNILYRFMPFHYHNQWGLIPGATGGGMEAKKRRILLILLPFCCHNFLPCKIIKISRLYDSLCSTLQINCSSFSGNLSEISLSRTAHIGWASRRPIDYRHCHHCANSTEHINVKSRSKVSLSMLTNGRARRWSTLSFLSISPSLSMFDSGSVLLIKLIQNTWKKLTNRIYDNPRHKLLSK